jgi:hypothetical protein
VSTGKRKRRQEEEEEEEEDDDDDDDKEEDKEEDEGKDTDISGDEDEDEDKDDNEADDKGDNEAEAEGEVGEGAVLKDNVVWSSTEAGFPLCTFRSFGTHSRLDGTIAIDLTSSAEDEARVFKSSADLKASLLATLDAIENGGMHPEAAFTLTSAPEATVAVVVGTQEAQASPTSTPSAADPPKKKKVVAEVGSKRCRRRRLNTSAVPEQAVQEQTEAAISPRRRSQRHASMNEQQARILELALAKGVTDGLVQDKLSHLLSGPGASAHV